MSTISAGTTSTTTLVHSGDTTGSLVFKTNDTGSGGTTAMTIDTSQNVGIGTSSPANTLDVNGTIVARCPAGGTGLLMRGRSSDNLSQILGYDNSVTTLYGQLQFGSAGGGVTTLISNGATGYTNFFTNGSERMRIDSSGNLLVGTTSAASSGAILTLKHPSSASVWGVGPYSAGTFLVYNGSNGVYMTAGATSWTSTSDARLKNITGKYDNALADISQLEPVKFTWKSDADNKPQVGVLAQSVEKVVPEAIEKSKIPNSDDETEYLGVRYTELVPLLTAALQELKAINDQQAETINALTARVVALESK